MGSGINGGSFTSFEILPGGLDNILGGATAVVTGVDLPGF